MDVTKVVRKSNYELYGDAADEIERLESELEQANTRIEALEAEIRIAFRDGYQLGAWAQEYEIWDKLREVMKDQ